MSTNDPFYDRFKPAQTDPFASWQYNIQNNFNTLSQSFEQNHVGFLSATQPSSADQGKHTVVQLLAGIEPQTDLSENNVYTKLDVNMASQIFMAMQNDTADFQWSALQGVYNQPQPNNGFRYITSLPGNFAMNVGIAAYTGDKTVLITNTTFAESIAFVYTSAIYPLGLNQNPAAYFLTQLVASLPDQPKGNNISVVWKGNVPAPATFFFMYIEKLKEVPV